MIAVILLVLTTSGIAGWFFLNRPQTPDYVTTTDEYATGSLRWAIGTAHAGETITFDLSLVGRTIVLQNADIHIFQQHLTIQSPATGRITIREIRAGLIVDQPASVTISGLAFQGSNTKDQSSLIQNQGKLTLKDCIISGNMALLDGGIRNYGTLTLTNSTVSGNTVTGGPLSDGGGIDNEGGGTLTLNNSTVSGNTAFDGGGIYNNSVLMLSNSTISDNRALSSDGGGIAISDTFDGLTSPVQVILLYCTVYGNTANIGGGGIWVNNGNKQSQVIMGASIVAGNNAHTGPDIAGRLTTSRYNLVGDPTGATFLGPPKLLSTDMLRV